MITKPQNPTVLRALAGNTRQVTPGSDAKGLDLQRKFWMEERAEIFERCAALEELIAAIGAKQGADGEWMLPYYLKNGNVIMLSLTSWIAGRRAAAELLGEAPPPVCELPAARGDHG